ncbi:unnamed protein product [Dovyalis caffra]|uniref:Uncharacterized protein n=1 Tax=Dovyalis caffra TaxID=77055 RepID=A0AAV1S4W1_9ROSI|nr:unnamed protein product [Dovyalis caffra]
MRNSVFLQNDYSPRKKKNPKSPDGSDKEWSRSSLPSNSQTMQFSCNAENIDLGMHVLYGGEVYNWKVEKKSTYNCAALRKLKFARWNAFELPRDENRETVYWAARENGFYLSWDKAKWVRNSTWESE